MCPFKTHGMRTLRIGVGIGHVWAAVDEVAEKVDAVLKVLLNPNVHLLVFLNWGFCRIEVTDFCLEVKNVLSFGRADVGACTRSLK